MSGAKIIVLIVVILLIFIYYNTKRVVPITSGVDGNVYLVSAGYQNKQQAANMLGRINLDMLRFLRYLKSKYHVGEPDDLIRAEGLDHTAMNRRAIDVVHRILYNYNFESIVENNPKLSTDTSYTTDKTKLHVCLRNRTHPNQLVDYHTLVFVVLHELAHMGNVRFGHETDFWEIFKFVLHEAQLVGVYDIQDFGHHPVNYCGLEITYQPLYDSTLRNIWESA